ncbi:LacI family transcriptional regulator [Butyricicoccus sp. 1XD8-22]|nr:LacI family transcriptional regulator [Butyricicoccus sp. 1XD8-22]
MASTILDVAKLSGYSKSTVSRTFLSPENVPEQTRKKVLEAARVLNYTPNAIARAMVRKKTDNVAFIISAGQYPASLNPFYSPLLEGVLQTMRRHGYSLLVLSDSDLQDAAGDFVLKKQMDGVIIAGHIDLHFILELKSQEIPTVLVNYTAPSDDICYVSADHYGGAVQAMEHLIGCGHQKIGLMAGRFSPQIYADRYQAYTDTLKKHHIPLDYRYIQTIDAKVEDAKHCVEIMLGLPDPPTALFCTNDTIAVGAIKAANALHKKVPDDLAIAGFDDSPICSMMEPEITSVHIDTFSMGEISANMLVALIEKKELPIRSQCVPAQLVVRKTTALRAFHDSSC